jgi:glycosyltransferase involved in cell wall biosynthesis
MIHLLICPHTLDYGGSQLGILHWAKHLDPAGFKVSVLAMRKGGLSEKFEGSFPVYYDDIDYPGIKDYIERLKPDLVHCAPGGGVDHDYIRRASTLVPVTQTVMCPRQAGNYDDVAGSVVISKYVLGIQHKKERVIQIDLPFDPSDYTIRYGREHFNLPGDKLIVGSLGNGRKENSHFLKIARRYGKSGVHFAIKTDKRFRSIFARNRVTTINRWLTEDEKLSLMDCFDIFMYPTSNEAYGLVFLESMSRGVPVVTYDDSANGEVVAGGGLLAPLNDIGAMEALLDRLVADRGERQRLGEHGARLVAERNDPKRIAGLYEEFFRASLERDRRARA